MTVLRDTVDAWWFAVLWQSAPEVPTKMQTLERGEWQS